MSEEGFHLREAENVADLWQRNRLVRRMLAIRDGAVKDKATVEFWNREHPDEQISTGFEDSVIAWCDGKGPLPTLPDDAKGSS